MSQNIVINLDPEILVRLRDLAIIHSRSIEEEAREILRTALIISSNKPAITNLGLWCMEQFGGKELGDPVIFKEIRSGKKIDE